MDILLVTFLNCGQLYSILNRMETVLHLTPQQKAEIVLELRKVVPTCPVIIKSEPKK
jgi:hypothetical protein